MDRVCFTFWVTEECNLRCRYCYVSKKPVIMNEQTIENCIKFTETIMLENEDKELLITFHGGEPLLNFKAVKYLTEYLSNRYKERAVFELTTNGTVFNEEIYAFLIRYKFRISVSLDGTRECNDLNRIRSDGGSSYDETMKTLKYFKQYNYDIRIRMTINASNVHLFSDSFIYLFHQNAGVIAFAIDTYHKNYDNQFWNVFEFEIQKIMTYLKRKDFQWYQYYINIIRQCYLSPKALCSGGTDSFHIDGKGGLYPCMSAVQNSELRIGNVETGIDRVLLEKLQAINKKSNPGCEKCAAKKICDGEMCKIINKLDTGDFLKPCNYNCKLISIYNNLLKESREDEMLDKGSFDRQRDA